MAPLDLLLLMLFFCSSVSAGPQAGSAAFSNVEPSDEVTLIEVGEEDRLDYSIRNDDGTYQFGYQSGRLGEDGGYNFKHEYKDQDGVLYGQHGYKLPDGTNTTVSYVADARGYRVIPEGEVYTPVPVDQLRQRTALGDIANLSEDDGQWKAEDEEQYLQLHLADMEKIPDPEMVTFEADPSVLLAPEPLQTLHDFNPDTGTSRVSYRSVDDSGTVTFRMEERRADGVVVGQYGHRESGRQAALVSYVSDVFGYRVVDPDQPAPVVSMEKAMAMLPERERILQEAGSQLKLQKDVRQLGEVSRVDDELAEKLTLSVSPLKGFRATAKELATPGKDRASSVGYVTAAAASTDDAVIASRSDLTDGAVANEQDLTDDALVSAEDVTDDAMAREQDVTDGTIVKEEDVSDSAMNSEEDAINSAMVSEKDITDSASAAEPKIIDDTSDGDQEAIGGAAVDPKTLAAAAQTAESVLSLVGADTLLFNDGYGDTLLYRDSQYGLPEPQLQPDTSPAADNDGAIVYIPYDPNYPPYVPYSEVQPYSSSSIEQESSQYPQQQWYPLTAGYPYTEYPEWYLYPVLPVSTSGQYTPSSYRLNTGAFLGGESDQQLRAIKDSAAGGKV